MIYVLTNDVNAYDQYGEYFIHAWDHKPSIKEMMNKIEDHEWEIDPYPDYKKGEFFKYESTVEWYKTMLQEVLDNINKFIKLKGSDFRYRLIQIQN